MREEKIGSEKPGPAGDYDSLERENKQLRDVLGKTKPLLEKGKKAEEELKETKATLARISEPPLIYGTLLGLGNDGARVVYSGHSSQMLVPVNSEIDPADLVPGNEVLLDQRTGYLVRVVGPQETGISARVKDVLPDGRLIVTTSMGTEEKVVHFALEDTPRIGHPVLLDRSGTVAIQHLPRDDRKDLYVEEIPDIGWDDIGGLEEEKGKLRAMIEHPYLYPHYYKPYKSLEPSKGALLHGPPGCGKTLLVKALVHEMFKLRKEDMPIPVLVVWDEAEALFNTRGTGVSIAGGGGGTMSDTVVPQLLSQLDGLEPLNDYRRSTTCECQDANPFFYYIGGPRILNQFVGNTEEAIREVYSSARDRSNFVATILITNRPDMLDPALVREGRIDKKLYVPRPDRDAASSIFSVYLGDNDLPIHEAEPGYRDPAGWCEDAIEQLLGYLFSAEEPIALVEYRDGRRRDLHRKDLLSGSKIYAIVQRACETAIARQIDEGEAGLKVEYLKEAAEESYREEIEILTSGSPQKWSQMLGKESELIARISTSKGYAARSKQVTKTFVTRSGAI
jgi:proteasome-associated ATPase